MAEQDHWETVFGRKAADRVSWYRPHLERSIAFIEGAGLSKSAAIIDVGGGTSTLVDDLLDRGYSDVTVLDISPTAMSTAKRRLGSRANEVSWIVADITHFEPLQHHYEFWHD